MKAKVLALILGVGMIPLPLLSHAGWTADSTVVKLVVTSNGGVNVRLKPELQGCAAQAGYGANFASIYPDHHGIDRMKADLLAAYMTGTKVAIYLADETCKVGELILGGWTAP